MGREYQYDETGVFSYFVLSLLGLYLIPTTLSRARTFFGSSSRKPTTPFEELVHSRRALKQKNEKKSGFQIGFFLWVSAWIAFVFLAYHASQMEHVEQAGYNPYEILGITPGAVEAEIKLAYKKLSLIWHPDKNKGNEEEAERRFVDISKAYKVLTDEETRKNWEMYGNPDGKQDVSMGIALPKWIVQAENMAFVLGFYIFFLVLVVVFLGRWWSASTNFSQKNTAQFTSRLVALLQSKISQSGVKPFTLEEVFRELAFAPEFVETLPEEESEASLLEDIAKDSENWVVPPPKGVRPAVLKTFYFLHCHLKQIKVPSQFENDSQFVVKRSVSLLHDMLKIRGLPIHSSCFSRVVELQEMLTQATWNPIPLVEDASPSSQGAAPKDSEATSSAKKRGKAKARVKAAEKADEKTSDSGDSTENAEAAAEVEEASESNSQVPHVHIATAKIFVVDEEEIRVGDKLTFNLKVEITYNKPEDKKKETVSKEEEESDYEEREKKRVRNAHRELLPAYAPLFPEARPSTWWVTLVDEKGFSIFCANLKELTSVDTLKNGTTFYFQERFQWQKLGKSTFKVHVVSDSYLHVKASQTLEINQHPPKFEPLEDYDDDADE